jgi:predicted AAA+ superfamily ATPase
VVVLTGARQVGKSTLLANEEPFRDWRYVSLDDYDALDQAHRDPSALWAGTDRIVLDEVQRAPGILTAVKLAVDQDRSRRFALSGSANLLLMRHVSESLAGRAAYVRLEPMALGEERGTPPPTILSDLLSGALPKECEVTPEDPVPLMLRGLMPSLMRLDDPSAVVRWWEGYATTYLERDLRQLSQVASLPDFRRVMEALALRSGQLLNQSDIARDTSVSQPTVHRYLNLMETGGLLERVPAFAANRTKRLIKSPKAYWLDPGLTSFLAGHYDAVSLRASREAGPVFECLVLLHLRVLAQLMTPRPRIHYWRTVSGVEVDFVIEHGRRLLPIEVKLAESVRFSDAAHLRTFMAEYPEANVGVVVYAGTQVRYLDERIVAIPWTLLTGAA